ncbi:MAG: flippase, partial [Pseudomonadota bacterium]
MSLGRAVFRNTLYLISAQGVTSAVAFVQAILLVRYLGKEAYGVWNVAMAWPGIFFVLTDLGLNSYVLREVAADRGTLGYYFINMVAIKVALSAVFVVAVWLAAQACGYEPRVAHYIVLASLAQAAGCFEAMFTALFRAIQRFAYESVVNGVKAVGLLGLALGVIHHGWGVRELLLGSLVWQVVLTLGCFGLLLRHWKKPRWEPLMGLAESLRFIRRASPFALITFILPIFYQIDIVMLSKLADMEAVGIYSAAYKLVMTLMVIPRAFKNALFPTLSRLFQDSREHFAQAFVLACKVMALAGFPLAFLIFAQAEGIVTWLYSGRYGESVQPLRIIAFSLLFTARYSATQAAPDASRNE